MSEKDLPPDRAKAVEKLAEAAADPVAAAVIALLAEVPGLTAREISDRIGTDLRKVRYRLAHLREAGLVAVSGQGERRGAIEHRYSMAHSTVFTDKDLSTLSADLRSRLGLSVFRRVAADVSIATRAGTFGVRPGHAEVRFVGDVDQRGWEALAEISEAFFGEAERALREARGRLAENDETGTPVTAALFLSSVLPDDQLCPNDFDLARGTVTSMFGRRPSWDHD